MKRTIIIISALFFGISILMSQNIQQQVEQQRQEQIQQEQSLRDAVLYQEAIASAQRNFNQGQYAQARQYYITARGIRPESTARINQRIAEIDRRINEVERQRELEQRYQNAITSAQRNFEQGHYAQAKQYYLTALELRPAEAASINPRIAEIDRRLAEQAVAAAQRNFEQGEYAQARQNYMTALELQPERAAAINPIIVEIDIRLAEIERERRHREALASAERYFSLQQYISARQYFLSARTIMPENAEFINQRISEINRLEVLSSSGTTVSQFGRTLSTAQVRTVMARNPEALRLYDRGIRSRNTGNTVMIGGLIGIGVGVLFIIDNGERTDRENLTPEEVERNQQIGMVLAGAGAGTMLVGGVIRMSGSASVRRSVETFNRGHSDTDLSLHFGITNNGVGLALVF